MKKKVKNNYYYIIMLAPPLKYSLQNIQECSTYDSPSKETMNIIHSLVEKLKGNTSSRFVSKHVHHFNNHTNNNHTNNNHTNNNHTNNSQISTSTPSSSTSTASSSSPHYPPTPIKTILGNVTSGFDSQLLLIRTYLNKTTDKTKNDMYIKIVNILTQIIHSDTLDENMSNLRTVIYNISSANIFYSKLFAGMYVQLISQFPKLSLTLDDKIVQFCDLSLFDAITINTPTTPYEQICKNNKTNDIIKSETTFLTNVLEISERRTDIERVMSLLVGNINTSKMDALEKSKNDEWIEYVFIMFKSLFPVSPDSSNYQVIQSLSKCKSKECPGLASKLIFKCLEMIEM